MPLLQFKAMPTVPIHAPEAEVDCRELDAIEALEPVDYEDESAEDAGISEAIRRVRRHAAAMRWAVVAAAFALAVGLAQSGTLEAIGVVASTGR